MEAQTRWRGGSRWRRRAPERPLMFSASLLCTALLFFFLLSYSAIPGSFFSPSAFSSSSSARGGASTRFPQCSGGSERPGASVGGRERFLWYAPHSGFSNQVAELKNAVLMAAILNRTLVVPPVLDHHAVVLGSCPKFRVSSPSDLRASVWDHMAELLRNRRFVSMGDVVDLSSLVSTSAVRVIDFRVFVSIWCGLDLGLACSASAPEAVLSSRNFQQCKALLSGLEGNVQDCIFPVEDDCRTTVWTYGQGDGTLDAFQPDKELRKKKKISYIRRRRDVYKALGPGSEAEKATVLAFGTLFSSPYKGSELYIDIHGLPANSPIQPSFLQSIEYLPFAQEILDAGREFALRKIKEPFLCAQLRLLDGQFKNHWKTTFSTLREKLKMLQAEHKGKDSQGPINIFIMTDLPLANWTGNYLGALVNNPKSYKLHSLHEGNELVMKASKMLMVAGHGLRAGFLPGSHNVMGKNKTCAPQQLPDILLYVEETVCSCATLGFVGTSGSTIAASIELMRRHHTCNSSPIIYMQDA
ncbi:hypothetical protein Taro_031148 [Colocasia esculenta]|uniref:O-fucosyltransferase family protein n=1 Tax=Colocasia esculenta TaxID=4460 RepID=A0A843VVX1_COLES|nr:hypothetical protein [Colocasia esculenta]